MWTIALTLFLACADKGGPVDDTAGTDSGSPDTGPVDSDGDGVPDRDDCAPGDPTVFPGADELCNDVDDDCDGEVDEDAVDPVTWYPDADCDLFPGEDGTTGCAPPGDGAVYPRTQEDWESYEHSSDMTGTLQEYCERVGGGWYAADAWGMPDAFDCDDDAADAFPGNETPDACGSYADGLDNDCDGTADGGVDYDWTWDGDCDGDGAGDALVACAPPDGAWIWGVSEGSCPDGGGWTATPDRDCDDTDPAVNRRAEEVCDGIDDDCDGLVDDDDDDLDRWRYWDGDGDGFGTDGQHTCGDDPRWIEQGGDCDDTDPAFHPGAWDPQDGDDRDCDGGDAMSTDRMEMLDDRSYDRMMAGGDFDDHAGNEVAWAHDGMLFVHGSAGSWTLDILPTAGELTVAAFGDVDGDGRDDLLMTEPYEDGITGVVRLLPGPLTADEGLEALTRLALEPRSGGPGIQVTTPAADVDDDGVVDLILVETEWPHYGADLWVHVVPGDLSGDQQVADVATQTWSTTDEDGVTAATGDWTGDGVADLALGALFDGAVGLIEGGADWSGDLDRDAAIRLTGPTALGQWLATGADLDGDGQDDLVFGLEDHGLYVVAGPIETGGAVTDLAVAHIERTSGDRGTHGFGSAPDATGDVDGDGQQDLWIRDLDNEDAHLFLGPLAGGLDESDAALVFVDLHGELLAVVGDTDGDGRDDLALAGISGAHVMVDWGF